MNGSYNKLKRTIIKITQVRTSDSRPVQLPVAEQLQQALQNLWVSSQTISDLKEQATRAEGHANKLEQALNRTQNELLKRDQEISTLRLKAQANMVPPREETDSGETESQRSLRVAQETIQELRVCLVLSDCRQTVCFTDAYEMTAIMMFSNVLHVQGFTVESPRYYITDASTSFQTLIKLIK